MRIRFTLREVLAQRGMTPYRLAKKTRLNLSTVYRMTAGRRRPATLKWRTLEKICDALDAEPGELFARGPARGRGRR